MAKNRGFREEYLFTAPENLPQGLSPKESQDYSRGFLQMLLPKGKKEVVLFFFLTTTNSEISVALAKL